MARKIFDRGPTDVPKISKLLDSTFCGMKIAQ